MSTPLPAFPARPFCRLPFLDARSEVAAWPLIDVDEPRSAEDRAQLLQDHAQAQVAGPPPRPRVLRCHLQSLLDGSLDGLAGEDLVFELALPAVAHEADAGALAAVLAQGQDRGLRVAFDQAALASVWRPCVGQATYLRIDAGALPAGAVGALAAAAREHRVPLAGTCIETAAQHEQAAAQGFTLFQGPWFMGRAPAGGVNARPSQSLTLEVIGALLRDVDVQEIETLLKRDPVLSFCLMRFVNSSGLGLNCEVTSFRHAVMIVGRDKLLRWCCLLVAAKCHAQYPALGTLAVVRGRFMELLAGELPAGEARDHAFVTGLFSLLDAMTGIDLKRSLEPLPLPRAILDALLLRRGPLAPVLALATAYESGNAEQEARAIERLHLSRPQVAGAYRAAIAWAEELLALSHA